MNSALPRGAPPRAREGWIVFSAALLFYVVGLAPDVLWGDSAQFQAKAAELDIEFRMRGYPLYSFLLWLFGRIPVGTLAFRANLLSAVAGAGAIALVFAALRRLSLSRAACVLAAGSLLVSHTFWSQAEIAEVYTLHAFFLAAISLLLLDPRRMTPFRTILLGLTLGASFLHHVTIAFVLPACGLCVLMRIKEFIRPRGMLVATLLASGIAFLPVLGILIVGAFPAGALSSGGPGPAGRVLYAAKFLALNFPSPVLIFMGIGVAWAVKRSREPRIAFLLAAAAVHAIGPLVLKWHSDQWAFLIPAYLFLAMLAAHGLDLLRADRRALRICALVLAVALPPAVYFGLGTWLEKPSSPDPLHLERAYYRSFLIPPKTAYRRPREVAEEVFVTLPERATVVTTWGEGMALLFLQRTEGRRPDLEVVIAYSPDVVRQAVAKAEGPVFGTRFPYFPEPVYRGWIPAGYRMVKEGDGAIYRIVRE